MNPFHLAIPVSNLDDCRRFYRDTMGFNEGRSDDRWVDFDMYGHQLVIHQVDDDHPVAGHQPVAGTNPVDGHDVPVPHFGVVLPVDQWHPLADRLKAAGIGFVVEPHVRFAGEAGEQHTMFFLDPSGNALEFKAFADLSQLFATDTVN